LGFRLGVAAVPRRSAEGEHFWVHERRLRRWTAAVATAVAVAAGARADAQPTEAAVKAAYLAKFAPFVVWPPAVFASPAAPLSLCVLGDDPFGPLLDRMAAGESVGGHPVAVRRVAHLDADSSCQIAYLGGSSAQARAAALKAVDGLPVLTVTDAYDGDGGRGIVHLVLVDGRVRFQIDDDRARRSGLAISSRLLALGLAAR